MKTKSIFLIGCSSVVLILILAFLAGYFLGLGPRKQSIGSSSWLVLDLNGEIADYNELNLSGFWGTGTPSVEDICRKIRHAAGNSKVKGIIIKSGMAQINYANLNEIKAALQEFKASKKQVIAHGEILSQKGYMLSAMADKVYMDPTASGGLILEGVSANLMFFKEALDKLGIKMHVMQAGEFKGAGETYTQTALTPGTEANLRKVLKARYDLLLGDIAQLRKLDSLAVRNVYENRPDLIIHASDAQKSGLIDKALSWDDMLAEYKIDKDKCISVADYSDGDHDIVSGAKVAIVNLSGNITQSQGFYSEAVINAERVEEILQSIKDDGNVKAIVLRVNSPGGSATESELIYQKLQRLNIPIVVSMGGVAASGGYYISCAGDYIFADPYTITGSIGVIMAIPEATKLGDKLGIDSQTLSYGKFSGFGNVFESYDQELLNSLQRNSESVYTEFKQRVMDARKISPEDITAVAEGRVFSASDAKSVKLIDEIGGIDSAVKKAASLAGISRYKVQQYPHKIGMMELLRKGGLFQNSLKHLLKGKVDWTERALEYMEKTLPVKQWLYFLPYQLEDNA